MLGVGGKDSVRDLFSKRGGQKWTEVRVASRFGKCLSIWPLVVRRSECGQGVRDSHRNSPTQRHGVLAGVS